MSSIEPTTQGAEPGLSAATSPVAVHPAIEAANARFVEAFCNHDAHGVAACYTPDAQLLPAHSDVVEGREAIEAFWRGAMEMGIAEVRLETIEVEAREDLAAEVGRYVLAGAEGTLLDRGKYVVVWHRQDGGWQLHRDIWTSSQPQPSA